MHGVMAIAMLMGSSVAAPTELATQHTLQATTASESGPRLQTFAVDPLSSLGNPWIGLVPFATRWLTRSLSHEYFPHSMENFYYPMAKLMDGWNSFTLDEFEAKLTTVSEHGNQAIVRIYIDYPGRTMQPEDGVPQFLVEGLTFYNYGKGVTPDWANTTLIDAVVQLVEKMGSTYDNDPRIAFWQVGLLGNWGEWHEAYTQSSLSVEEWHVQQRQIEQKWYEERAARDVTFARDYAQIQLRGQRASSTSMAQSVASLASAVPGAPTDPPGSCWIFEPSGCPSGNGEGAFTAWRRDSWGERNGYDGASGCTRRAHDLNYWCGTTDVITHYVPFVGPPSPPPSPPAPLPPAPEGTPGSCWIVKPSGCPDGNGESPSNRWTRDWWGESNGYAGAAGCLRRQNDLNNWCGTNNIKTHYDPASSPPPSPPNPPPVPLPPAPAYPLGTCWYVEPSGCPDGNGVGPFTTWVQDTWGPANGYAGGPGCTRREADLNTWCGTTDIQTHYVQYTTVQPVPPGGVPFATPLVQRRVLLAFNRSFSMTGLLVRYPDVTGGLAPSTLRIGFHDDSFDQDTLGPQQWTFMQRMRDANATTRYMAVPIGGEVRPEMQGCIFGGDINTFCAVNGMTPMPFIPCADATRSSWQWDHKLFTARVRDQPAADIARARAAAGNLGYAFHLEGVQVVEAPDGSSFSVACTIRNVGVAPAYYPVTLSLTYPCGAANVSPIVMSTQVGELQPSTASTYTVSSVSKTAGSNDDACVGLTSPRALSFIRFATAGADPTSGAVHFGV